MNVSFTKQQEEYIAQQVNSGDYQNNSEVVREALRLHSIYRDRVIQDLRQEVERGLKSGISGRKVADIIKAKLQ